LARVLDAATGLGLSGVRGVHPEVTSSTSDGTGRLELASESALGAVALRFDGDTAISRDTWLRIPGEEAVVSLIPSGFDLAAFDEMARRPALTRWVSPPPLVIERRVLAYADLEGGTMQGTTEARTDEETSALVTHFVAALPELTGGVLTQFARTDRQLAEAGAAVSTSVSGQITVFWVDGLLAATGFAGYARWEFSRWAMTGGVVLLDADADRGPNQQWLRWHELGHTLGYTHVTVRPSLMAPAAQPITPFDRQAGRIAYSRPPGNRSPDRDPDDSSLNSSLSPVAPRQWSPWIR
jgi:hypothetical protein